MSFIKKLAAMTSVAVVLFVLVYAFQRALLNENVSPQWRNQIQSTSAIAQGEYVCLQAEASDVTGLRKAVLATNETDYAFKIGSGSGDWPMFCRNNLHRSFSENGIEYVR